MLPNWRAQVQCPTATTELGSEGDMRNNLSKLGPCVCQDVAPIAISLSAKAQKAEGRPQRSGWVAMIQSFAGWLLGWRPPEIYEIRGRPGGPADRYECGGWQAGSWIQEPELCWGLGPKSMSGTDLTMAGRSVCLKIDLVVTALHTQAWIAERRSGRLNWGVRMQSASQASLSTDKNEGRWRGGSWLQEPDSSMGLGLEGETETDPSIPGLHLPGDTLTQAQATQRRCRRLNSAPGNPSGVIGSWVGDCQTGPNNVKVICFQLLETTINVERLYFQ
ncbi:hypothetical protein DFP72DRAFT_839570 [Ephemerocybe angulata]|uniref:Uncharacterized protein n=1 Tax=Ephemerocybe angulata TaxID=980116 RepID=A0A8H6MHN3_9AGAR|nr:hypothetical protein DFP72DRAFT_839570 [Tulosesus angulatus]